ncbi:MAG TPA: peptidylprolyl isomerase [Sedimentisphaerales bacterium]|nr:peptidylprolyl isomerase [Sedimentisphaerales bacterium]
MVLIVNGEKIEDSAIKQEAERLRPDYERVFTDQDNEEREAQLLDWSRENVIEKILINQEAEKNGDKIPPEQVQAALAKVKEQYDDPKQLYKDFNVENDEQIEKDIAKQMRVEQRIGQVCKDLPKPSQAAIKKYYEENQEQFKTGERARVAHIVKYVNWQTDEKTAYEAISQAYEELKSGVTFEVVVDKHTDCADSGGDLGFVMKGQMVEEFEDVVFNLGAGQVSDIFRTRFGFHIAKVYAREPAAVASLEDVKDRITELLNEQMRSEAIDKFIDGLKSEAKIEEV